MSGRRLRMRRAERGAALLAVLGLVVLLGGLATVGLSRLGAATDLSHAARAGAAARMAASAGIAAAQALALPKRAAARTDPATWGQPEWLDLGGATAEIRFAEAPNCFNLNSLAQRREGRAGDPEPMRAGGADFARLLRAAGLGLIEAEALGRRTAAMVGGRGVLLADPSEWLEVPGVTPELYARVAPLLCALPNRDPMPLNVQRLSRRDLPILAGLGFDEARARAALAGQPGGFSSVSRFWQAMGTSEGETEAAAAAGVSSRYVEVHVIGRAMGAEAHRLVLLDSAAQPARVVAARWLVPPAQGSGA